MKSVQKLFLIFLTLMCSALFAQGSFIPPAGAPAATMKSLQDLEDAIDALNLRVDALQQNQAAVDSNLQAAREQSVSLLETLDDLNTWTLHRVPGSGSQGSNIRLVYNAAHQPMIAYYDEADLDLKVAQFDGSGWNVTTLSSIGDVGDHLDVDLNPVTGYPAISFYDRTMRDVKVATSGPDFSGGTLWLVTSAAPPRAVDLRVKDDRTLISHTATGEPVVAYIYLPPNVVYPNPTEIIHMARMDDGVWGQLIDENVDAEDRKFLNLEGQELTTIRSFTDESQLIGTHLGNANIRYEVDSFGFLNIRPATALASPPNAILSPDSHIAIARCRQFQTGEADLSYVTDNTLNYTLDGFYGSVRTQVDAAFSYSFGGSPLHVAFSHSGDLYAGERREVPFVHWEFGVVATGVFPSGSAQGAEISDISVSGSGGKIGIAFWDQIQNELVYAERTP